MTLGSAKAVHRTRQKKAASVAMKDLEKASTLVSAGSKKSRSAVCGRALRHLVNGAMLAGEATAHRISSDPGFVVYAGSLSEMVNKVEAQVKKYCTTGSPKKRKK